MASEPASCPSNVPPVTTHNYQPRGKWQKIAGIGVYVVGPPDSPGQQSAPVTRAIVAAYDVFGVMPQTVQGCDRMAEMATAWVLMVDFFGGDALPVDAYPIDTDEKKKIAADWRARSGSTEAAAEKLLAVVAAAKDQEEWKGMSWGAYGLCWGGKLVVLHSGKDTPFKASGTAHPGRIAVEDAKALTIPYICLFSKKDAAPELVEEYGNALKEAGKENVVDKYDDMEHGWLAGRANFEDAEVVKEFEKGYTQLADFFKKHL